MRLLRAGQRSARPLNCGVRRQYSSAMLASDLHPSSGLIARVCLEPSSAAPHSIWLYLSDGTKIVADCFVEDLANTEAAAKSTDRHSPPPVARKYLAGGRTVVEPKAESLLFQWSDDGKSVCLRVWGSAHCFIGAGRRRGHTRALVASCPWGEPWSEALFESLFRRGQTAA
jgi:hypothetical protein